jgi:hypothetical protein
LHHERLVTHDQPNQLWLCYVDRGFSISSTTALFRLDYISCLLPVLSTIMVGRRIWYGWLVAGANSVIIGAIGLKTSQTGFIPANLFCIALYGYNVVKWRGGIVKSTPARENHDC